LTGSSILRFAFAIVMTGVFEHYRVSSLGQELRDCLDEMIENEELNEQQYDIIFQQFDKAICNALAKETRCRAVVRASLSHYRSHDDIWTVRTLLYVKMLFHLLWSGC
jgi:Transcription initiation factor IIA, gamma subunit, helical domain